MTISQADYNRLGRTTPTARAEARYAQEQAARAKPMPIGLEGIAIPDDRVVFRPTLDVELLKRIWGAAVNAHGRRVGAEQAMAAAADILADHLRGIWPQDEAAACVKWNVGRTAKFVTVTLPHIARVSLYPREPVLVPGNLPTHFNLDGNLSNHAAPIEAIPHLAIIDSVGERRKEIGDVVSWAVQFKKTAGRLPRWFEITEQWPLIKQWIVEQRAGMASDGQ